MAESDTKQTGEYFGVDRHVAALLKRIDASFERAPAGREAIGQGPARGDGALVVGIYGPWGCGKTTWLRRLERVVEQREHAKLEELTTPKVVTIPITFNAWQFEREEHLIVPLLKTAETVVRKFVEEIDPGEDRGAKAKFVRWLGEAWKVLGDASVALASGLSGEFTFGAKTTLEDTPLGKVELSAGPKLSLNMRTVFDKYAALRAARAAKDSPASPLDAYASLYFDLRGHMRALTGRAERPGSWKALDEAGARLHAEQAERRAEQAEADAKAQTRWWQLGRRRALELKREAELASPQQAALPPANDDVDADGFELNLLFLIDDLDRCLPEKGVEMLEAIKLFLEVPGCAFVLAVDDEMVERGILHRYRDYGLGQQRKADPELDARPPITGAEYLEKIVHLPVHVPPPSRKGVRGFVEGEYGALLAALGPDARRSLLDLFDLSLPLVPRKVVRTLELFAMLHELGRGQPKYDPILLARLVLIQLFAPELYRVRRMRFGKNFLVELQTMKGRYLPDVVEEIEQSKQKEGLELKDKITLGVRERIANTLARILAQRVDFDPRDALAAGEDYSWERIEFHLNMVIAEGGAAMGVSAVVEAGSRVEESVDERTAGASREARSVAPAAAAGARSPLVPLSRDEEDDEERELVPIGSRVAERRKRRQERRQQRREESPRVQLRDIAGFVAFALSESREGWRRALDEEGERLAGHVLDDMSFAGLLAAMRERPDHIQAAWVETFGGLLTIGQLQTILREAKVLVRLRDASGEAFGQLVSAICRRVNPPQAEIAEVNLALFGEGLGRDFSQCSFEGAYLRGLSLREANLAGVVLRRADLEQADLSRARLVRADLSGARLWNALLDGAVLDEATLEQADVHGCSLRGASLKSADLRQSAWSDCDWEDAVVAGARVGATWANHAMLGIGGMQAWAGFPSLATGHSGPVLSVAWSPDGHRIASASCDRTIRIWTADGRLLAVLEGHTGEITSLAWSTDGEWLASGSDDGTARVWKASGERTVAVLKEHRGVVRSVAWSGDGERLAIGSDNKAVRVWKAIGGHPIAVLEGHGGVVRSVAWSTDGLLASGSDDTTVRVWDTNEMRAIAVLDGHGSFVRSVAWSNDGKLASGSDDKTVRVWDTNEIRAVAVLQMHEASVRSVAWSADGRLASGSDDKMVCVWDVVGERTIAVLQGHEASVRSVAWSTSGKLASGSVDATLRVWDTNEMRAIEVLEGHLTSVRSVAWSADGKLAVGSDDALVRVWDLTKLRTVAEMEGHEASVRSVAWSTDGKLASGSDDATVRVWDSTEGRAAEVLEGHTDWVKSVVRSVAWSSGGMLASGADDATIRMWAGNEGRSTALNGHEGVVWSVAWSSDGLRLASASSDANVRVWEASGRTVAILSGHTGWVMSVAWSTKGTLASGSVDRTVRVWQVSGERGDSVYRVLGSDGANSGGAVAVLNGHTDLVTSVAWSIDGLRLASGSADNTVRIWDPNTQQPIATLTHAGPVNAVAWSPDGTRLASASSDGTIRLWDTNAYAELLVIEQAGDAWLIRTSNGNFSLSDSPTIPAMLAIPTDPTQSRVFVPLAGLRLHQDPAAIAAFLAGTPTTRAIEPEPRWDGRVLTLP